MTASPALLPLTDAQQSRAAPDDPVRVCFLIDELALAGTETQLLALIRHLDRRRVLPHLCLLRGDSPASRALEPDDCPVRRLGVGSLSRPAALARMLRFARLLRRWRIDVLQVFFPDSTYFGLPAAWLAGVPHRVRSRNNLGHWLTPVHRVVGRSVVRLATHTVTNCPAARDALQAEEGPAGGTIVVLENGVDLRRFDQVPLLSVRGPDEPVRVGVVANLRPVKGLDLLVEAAARLAAEHPQAVYEVAGEGELRPELERQVRERCLQGRFVLRGKVNDVPAFLGRLQVAVLCSHAEGMSNALLEYMAAGRAIVATAVGAATDLMTDGVHGLLVPPGDASALAAALDRLLRQPELAVRLGLAARARACQRYGREAMVRRFEDFYEGLRSSRGERGRRSA
jgi:glycosyltransferase involved in cell wall biosynthesis